jgi:hypothetical protein
MLRPPLDSFNLAWLGYEDNARLITWRDFVQFTAAVVAGYGALWLGHVVVRWLFP